MLLLGQILVTKGNIQILIKMTGTFGGYTGFYP